MPKHDFMSPKAIANRMKSKGLQKLRWFCQMCEKQCRDANGFKCHNQSEAHLRQMKLFSENASHFLDEYSREFDHDYLAVLKRKGGQRVAANKVYMEMIQDRNHTHIHSTTWGSLTAYVKYLGEKGTAIVEDTPKGFFVTYVERDAAALRRQEEARRKERADAADAQRTERKMEERIKALKKQAANQPEVELAPLDRPSGAPAIGFQLAGGPAASSAPAAVAVSAGQKRKIASIFNVDDEEDSGRADDANGKRPATSAAAAASGAGDSKSKEKKGKAAKRKDYWLKPGIVVKIVHKTVAGGAFYKKKATVLKVHDKYVGEVQVHDADKSVVRFDQEHLETVIPKPGGRVLVVNGEHRGQQAVLVTLLIEQFAGQLELDKTGQQVQVEYEDFSKLA